MRKWPKYAGNYRACQKGRSGHYPRLDWSKYLRKEFLTLNVPFYNRKSDNFDQGHLKLPMIYRKIPSLILFESIFCKYSQFCDHINVKKWL